MSKSWYRGVAAAVVAAVVLSSALVAQAGEAKSEKRAAKEGKEYFEGVISSVDFKAKTVTVKKDDAGSMTFATGADAKFYPKQKKEGGALSDFKVGDKVEVWYTVDAGNPTLHTLGEKGARAEHKEKQAVKGK